MSELLYMLFVRSAVSPSIPAALQFRNMEDVESPGDFESIKPDTLYIGDKFVTFKDGAEVVYIPVGKVDRIVVRQERPLSNRDMAEVQADLDRPDGYEGDFG